MRTLSCFLLIAGGCGGSSQADEVRDARMERADDRAEAKEAAADQREDARSEAVDERYDDREQRVEAGNRPGEDGDEKLVEISRERAEYQVEARNRLDKLGARINTAQQKIQVLGVQAPLSLKRELQTASKQYDAIKDNVQLLDQTPPSAWERTTDQLETREAELDARVDKLEDAIDDE